MVVDRLNISALHSLWPDFAGNRPILSQTSSTSIGVFKAAAAALNALAHFSITEL
jgi:hypothetical protein